MKTQRFYWIPFLCLALLAGTSLFAVLLFTSQPSAADDVNTIRGIKTTSSRVEVEVSSTRSFPVRALPHILHIGDKEFALSRYPDDGSLNTLIFILTADEFAQVVNGEQVVVQYGSEELLSDRWDFGALNKGLLDK